MNTGFCNCLYSIALSVIISFIFAILYFFGAFSEFIIILAFALIFTLLSLLIITILGEKIEFLPYHKLGMEKYLKLNIQYPCRNIPEMDKEYCKNLYNKFMNIYKNIE